MRTILLISDDRITSKALEKLETTDELLVLIDYSSNYKRVLNIILKRRISILAIIKMLICEYKRSAQYPSQKNLKGIKNNLELMNFIDEYKPERVVLFRAGLLITAEVISKGIPLMNIHCASIPKYGGLGAIHRALKDGVIHQTATLHHVTKKIDDGNIIDQEPYSFDLNRSYCFNENLAYEAGLRLLWRTLGGSGKGSI